MKNDLLLALSALASEKNLPREVVFEAVEAALTSAFRREGDNAPNINVKIDPIGGDIRAYRQMMVVEEVEEPHVEMTLADAARWKPDVRIGDVLDFEEQLDANNDRKLQRYVDPRWRKSTFTRMLGGIAVGACVAGISLFSKGKK